MRFIVDVNENGSHAGNLFFSAPTKTEINNAEDEIASLCHDKLSELKMKFASAGLEKELKCMTKTKSAFTVLLLREINDLSNKMGYPVTLRGAFSGSVIAYLLGLSVINPMSPYYACTDKCCYYDHVKNADAKFGIDLPNKICKKCGKAMKKDGFDIPLEAVWGDPTKPKCPGFEINVAPSVLPHIQKILDKKFCAASSDDRSFYKISIVSNNICEKLGNLYHKTGTKPTLNDLNEKIYLRVLKHLSYCDTNDEERFVKKNLLDQLQNLSFCDFYTVVKAFGLLHGSFGINPDVWGENFYGFRDDLFEALKAHNIPTGYALELSKKGLWNFHKDPKYDRTLKQYDVYEEFGEYFCFAHNLWSKSACIQNVLLMCYLEWYKTNTP